MDKAAMLRDLLSRDPDGWETKPTLADYRAFKAYVIATYGLVAWESYIGS